MSRVLVCGDRDWEDRRLLFQHLDEIHQAEPIDLVIEGEARGADVMAREWAVQNQVETDRYPALWSQEGRAAGPIRNRRMLMYGKPDFVVAFHDDLALSKGTSDMVRVARQYGVAVLLVSHSGKTLLMPEDASQ